MGSRTSRPVFDVMRCVLLRHDEPSGAHHFDWMLAREDPPRSALETYRVQVRPDEAFVGDTLSITPLGDHRLAYLTYEGPLSDNRGRVQRVAEGRCVRESTSVLIQWRGADRPWQRWQIVGEAAALIELIEPPLATETGDVTTD